ncbi:MAG: hypothetical protein OIF54_00660, partial [Cohaesibacter sp.]|nr:hypothetical protein [Cohaesibacter sp.]
SAYIRKCLFEDKESKRKKPRRPEAIADHQALAQVLGMLGSSRIANNLNQLASLIASFASRSIRP